MLTRAQSLSLAASEDVFATLTNLDPMMFWSFHRRVAQLYCNRDLRQKVLPVLVSFLQENFISFSEIPERLDEYFSRTFRRETQDVVRFTMCCRYLENSMTFFANGIVPIKRNDQLFRQSTIVQLNRRGESTGNSFVDLHFLLIIVEIFLRDEELGNANYFYWCFIELYLVVNFFEIRDRNNEPRCIYNCNENIIYHVINIFCNI